jgi:hypothetical protein
MIGRREFIRLLGDAATAWPPAASAQQEGKLWVVEFLSGRYAVTAHARGGRRRSWNQTRYLLIFSRCAAGA